MSHEDFLSRWSRRKLEAKTPKPEPEEPAAQTPPASPPLAAPTVVAPAPAPLPPVDSLTPESDFAPFMSAEVDPSLRRQALKALFQDPRFNLMDGLDVYIDDYSKPDPLPEGWLEKMSQVARLGDYRPPEEEVAAAETPGETQGDPEKEPEDQTVRAEPPPVPSDTREEGEPSST